MQPPGAQKLTSDVTKVVAHSLMNEAQREEFTKEMECNFAISIPGLSRFRVNVFVQQRCLSMVIRTIAAENSERFIGYEEAIRNADSANELRLNIKLKSPRGEPAAAGGLALTMHAEPEPDEAEEKK